jgi:hypothetical protein
MMVSIGFGPTRLFMGPAQPLDGLRVAGISVGFGQLFESTVSISPDRPRSEGGIAQLIGPVAQILGEIPIVDVHI